MNYLLKLIKLSGKMFSCVIRIIEIRACVSVLVSMTEEILMIVINIK